MRSWTPSRSPSRSRNRSRSSPLRAGALLAAALLGACQSSSPAALDAPPDVAQPSAARVVSQDGFRLWIEGRCLSSEEAAELLGELKTSRARLLELLGDHGAPGSFRPYGEPRELQPRLPVPDPIEVVVLPGGDRCHADRDGITLVKRHLRRRDGTHELVHFLAGSSWRPIDEGLAVYLTERLWGPEGGVRSKIRARVYRDTGLSVNLTARNAREGMNRRDYDVAGGFVGWLLEAFEPARFWQLYTGSVAGFEAAYGLSEAEMWARFWRYIENLNVRSEGSYYAFKARIRGGG